MRPPSFWFRPPERAGLPAALLSPLAALYARETARRVARHGVSVGVPVICVGNLNVGGTGKTPTVIALIQRLASRGVDAQVVSRGYGGRARHVTRVDPALQDAELVGDEPLHLSAFAPVWVGPDRVEVARMAVAAQADAILLDDGFQSPSPKKNLSIVVIDAAIGFGNERVLPAGPLRESVEAGLARADLVLSIGDEHYQARLSRSLEGRIAVPRVAGRLAPLRTGMVWTDLRVFAFAGIGRPEKFFATLREEGAEIVGTRALDDHQPLSVPLIARLEREARAANAQLVTTEKDAARLPASMRGKVLILPVRLEIDDWSPIDAALARIGL